MLKEYLIKIKYIPVFKKSKKFDLYFPSIINTHTEKLAKGETCNSQ